MLSPTIFTVTGIGDSLSDPHTATSGDLRYCVGLANANTSNPEGSLIQFDPTVFSTSSSIPLAGSGLTLSNTTHPTTITGPTAALTIAGGGAMSNFSVITVNSSVTVSFSGLTIANGHTTGAGGGIFTRGIATLSNCTLLGNVAIHDGNGSIGSLLGNGGGIYNEGTLTLTECTLSENAAIDTGSSGVIKPWIGNGGGIENLGAATLTHCTLVGNTATVGGGGIDSDDYTNSQLATITLADCTFTNNSTTYESGGGFAFGNGGTATLTNCMLSRNSGANDGAALYNGGTITVTGCTISGNTGGVLATLALRRWSTASSPRTQWPKRMVGASTMMPR